MQTNNTVQKYISSGGPPNLTDSLIFDDGSKVGISTTTLTTLLNFPAGTTPASGITFGTDANLYRISAGALQTDGAFIAAYALITGGAAVSPIVYGGFSSGDDITIESTADSTKGDVLIAPSGGKVGIGTTSPAFTFQVSSTGYTYTSDASGAFAITDSTTPAKKLYMGFDATNDVGFIAAVQSGVANKNIVFPLGNVGIGTSTPSEKLEVYNGSILCNLGHLKFIQVSAPNALTAAVLAVAGNVDIGVHSYKVTFVTALGETEGGTPSANITTSAGNQQVSLTSIQSGTSGIVTARRIYRKGAIHSTYHLLTTINDNTTTTYTDNVSNASLGNVIPLSNSTGGAITIGSNRKIQLDSTKITLHPQEPNWNPDFFRRSFTQNIKVLSSTENEFGAYFETTMAPTVGSGNYEKCALLSIAYQADPSSDSVSRDAVGADIRGVSVAGNAYGNVWGALIAAGTEGSTADGQLVGCEINVVNYGTDVSTVDVPKQKNGLQIVAMGDHHSTAAIYITSGTTEPELWHKGLISRESSYLPLSGSGSDANATFIELLGASTLFRVKPSGQTVVGSQTYASNVANYDPAFYGALSARDRMSVFDATTNKNIFAFLSSGSTSLNRIISTRYDATVSYWPIALEVGTTEVMRLQASGNVLIGLPTPDDATQGVLQVFRSQNNGVWSLTRNDSTGTVAYAAMVARSGSASSTDDITIGVTSSGFTTSSGVSASQGFIVTGTQATAGLVLQTRSGNIDMQAAGTVTKLRVFANGRVAINSTSDNGYQFEVNGTAKIDSTLVVGAGLVTNGVIYAPSGGQLTSHSGFTYDGSNLISGVRFTATGAGSHASGAGVDMYYNSGNSTGSVAASSNWANSTAAWLLLAGSQVSMQTASNLGSLVERLRVDADSTNALLIWANGALQRVTVGDSDSGGEGYRLLRIPN